MTSTLRLSCWKVTICINVAERKKRSKAQLHFMMKDDNSAACNVFNKGGKRSNMLKHLWHSTHSIKFQGRNILKIHDTHFLTSVRYTASIMSSNLRTS